MRRLSNAYFAKNKTDSRLAARDSYVSFKTVQCIVVHRIQISVRNNSEFESEKLCCVARDESGRTVR